MKYILTATSVLFLGSMTAAAQDGPPRMFERLDQDKNGVVTHAELMNEAQKHFAEFDQNNNDVIVLSELPEQMPLRGRQRHRLEKIKARQEARAERRGGDWEPRVSPEEMEERMRRTRLQFMASLDQDKNEQLDVEEFARPLIKRFKKADLDGDGSVTLEEYEDARQNMPKKHGRKHGRRSSR